MMCKVLIFSCISALMLVTAANASPTVSEKESLLKTLITDLEYLEKSKDKVHVDLFTANEKEECSQQTLQCYLSEMDILKYEVDKEDVVYVQNIQKNLQRLVDLTPTGTRCKICEANEKKNFPAFHQELNNFLKYMLKITG